MDMIHKEILTIQVFLQNEIYQNKEHLPQSHFQLKDERVLYFFVVGGRMG